MPLTKAGPGVTLISELNCDLTSDLAPPGDLSALKADWRALEARCDSSYFTSWNFIGPLLQNTAHPPRVFTARRGNTVVALALIAEKSRKSVLGTVKGLTLNQTGGRKEDLVHIEFNDVLCPNTERPAALKALAQNLAASPAQWSELHLCGFRGPCIDELADIMALPEADRKSSAAPYVDLTQVRKDGYLALLSRNTRSQIARSRRLFEQDLGALSLQVVGDEQDWRDALMVLADWQRTNFARTNQHPSLHSDFFMRFVTGLLRAERCGDTRAELVSITAGQTRLGLLVNLCHKGTAANYQCGFAPFAHDNRLKPGLVSHALAIDHYAAAGDRIYHFLGGDQQYKQSLATDVENIVWTRLQKPTPRLSAETLLKTARRRLRRKPAPAPALKTRKPQKPL